MLGICSFQKKEVPAEMWQLGAEFLGRMHCLAKPSLTRALFVENPGSRYPRGFDRWAGGTPVHSAFLLRCASIPPFSALELCRHE